MRCDSAPHETVDIKLAWICVRTALTTSILTSVNWLPYYHLVTICLLVFRSLKGVSSVYLSKYCHSFPTISGRASRRYSAMVSFSFLRSTLSILETIVSLLVVPSGTLPARNFSFLICYKISWKLISFNARKHWQRHECMFEFVCILIKAHNQGIVWK